MKLFVGSIIVFSLIILFLFALFPSRVTVTRMIRIHSPEKNIFNAVASLQSWPDWNEFVAGSNGRQTNQLKDSAGAGYLRTNDQVITLIRLDRHDISTLWQHRGKSFTAQFSLSEEGGFTMLVWTLNMHVRWYPWEKLASMFYERQLGPVMENSLVNLQRAMGR